MSGVSDNPVRIRQLAKLREGKAELSEMGERIAAVLIQAEVQPKLWVSWLATNMKVSKYAAHKWLHSRQQQISDRNARKLVKLLSQTAGRPFSLTELRIGGAPEVSSAGGSMSKDAESSVIPDWIHKLWVRMTPLQRDAVMNFALDTAVPSSPAYTPLLQLRRRDTTAAGGEEIGSEGDASQLGSVRR